jgi:peptidyl-prolyl cis-trans isomerase A (cyclophilin A)
MAGTHPPVYKPIMQILRLAAISLLCAAPALAQTAVIDTTAGRIACTLMPHERPATTAAFIALAKASHYDGARIFPASAGIRTRQDTAKTAPFSAETSPAILFDRPGLLGMAVAKGMESPAFLVLADHANAELDGHAVVFGQCDPASAALAAQLRHTLQSTDNHPPKPVVIDRIAIVAAGEPLPSPAPPFPSGLQPATPLAPPSGPEPTGPTAVFDTTEGLIRCRLFTRESPIATGTFIGLANGTKDWTDPTTHTVQHNRRFYDGMPIDRILPDFYVQFGDITGDISGAVDIGFRFPTETTPGLTFDRPGRLAFGNAGPDTNNSELYFALNPMHVLDGNYPIVGQCDAASLPIIDRIAHLPRDGHNLPLKPVVIHSITFTK